MNCLIIKFIGYLILLTKKLILREHGYLYKIFEGYVTIMDNIHLRIDSLPNELIQLIFSYITVKQRFMLGSCCTGLYAILKKNTLFKACSKEVKCRKVKLNEIVPNIFKNDRVFTEFKNIYLPRINYNFAFIHACESGNLEFVEWSILMRNHSQSIIMEAFERACSNHKINIINWFIDNNIICPTANHFPLICAAGDLPLVRKIFLKTLPAKIIQDNALSIACNNSYLDIVRWFASLGNKYGWDVHFNRACGQGNLELAKTIYEVCGELANGNAIYHRYSNVLREGQLNVAEWLDTLDDLYTNERSEVWMVWFCDALSSKNILLVKYVYDMIINKCAYVDSDFLCNMAIEKGHIDMICNLLQLADK